MDCRLKPGNDDKDNEVESMTIPVIVVRTHSASELAYLIAQGVDRAVMGELELALEMTDYALRSLGVSEERSKMVRQWLRTQEISRQK